jgi:hypothetical protein
MVRKMKPALCCGTLLCNRRRDLVPAARALALALALALAAHRRPAPALGSHEALSPGSGGPS